METLFELIERLKLTPHWVEKACKTARVNDNGTIFVLVHESTYTTFQNKQYADDCKLANQNDEIIEVRP